MKRKREPRAEIPEDILSQCVEYYPRFFDATESQEYFVNLLKEISFQQGYVKMFGKEMKEPRETFFASTRLDKVYHYSGKINIPKPMTETLMKIMRRTEELLGMKLESVLVNHYRTGKDSVDWHSDDESDIDRTKIVSVSFGQTRTFRMRLKNEHNKTRNYELKAGDVLYMKNRCQDLLEHQVPKTAKKDVGARINLTFRCMK